MSSHGSIVVVSPYRTEYGPREVLEHVSEAIVAAGYTPVLAVPEGAELTASLKERSGRIATIPRLTTIPRTMNVIQLLVFLRAHLSAARAIRKLAVEENAIAIYATSEATFCGGLAARRLELPSVVHAIGMSINSPRWVAAFYIRFLDRVTDVFVACSSAVAEMFAEHAVEERKNTVVHNGVDAAHVRVAGAQPITLAHDGPAVGMVAAYDSRKGHELFVEAAANVARRYPSARFYLIGGALPGQRESAAFEQRVTTRIAELGLSDHFEQVGYIRSPEVYRWIRAMDVIVVPSRTEAFAHALLEAMICERPVVATAIEGNLDAFVNGHSGIYVGRSPKEVADAIGGLLSDPARARAMGEAAGRHATRLFDLSVTVSANAQVIRELLTE
jgi:glycosyltransferase involved in cell wall biosynthesis